MKLREVFRIAWEAIIKNSIRSILTMLGIIIGVAAVIIMVAVSAGTEATIQEQITSLGSNLVFISQSFTQGGVVRTTSFSGGAMAFSSGGLTFDDANAIADNVNGVVAVNVEQNTSQTVKAGDVTLESIDVLGTTPGFPSVRDVEIASGRYFTQEEVDRDKKVIVLGADVATELFGSSDPVGQTVTVGTLKFAVIGVFKAKGTVGDTDYDARVYMPITVVFQKFAFSQFARFMGNNVRMIYVEVDKTAKMDDVILQIKLLLAKRHDVSLDSADFTITTQQDIIQTQESTTAAFRSLLAWVAGVSLVVGGIGIMNIMLVSVTERTREIGIRQAIGANPGDIRLQFLTEALLISIFGGLIGSLVGIGGAWLFSRLSDMRTVVSPLSILLAFGSAAIIGIFFGFYPANKAAQLDPIEALRYE
jgi:putative ABC transport system permease protein